MVSGFTIYTRATKFLQHDTFEVSVIMDSQKKLKRDGIIVKEGVCQLTPGANWPRSPLLVYYAMTVILFLLFILVSL